MANITVSLSSDMVSNRNSSAFRKCEYSKTKDDNSTDIATIKPHNSVNLMVSICSIHKSIKLILLESRNISNFHVRRIALCR